ncbi:hypothetical protein [Nocardioides koreensis]|uniref:hypothetical protein n=1 Tax=Nocardioides koreensis TaxID=433651 RepID=UPI0031CE78F3
MPNSWRGHVDQRTGGHPGVEHRHPDRLAPPAPGEPLGLVDAQGLQRPAGGVGVDARCRVGSDLETAEAGGRTGGGDRERQAREHQAQGGAGRPATAQGASP